MIALLNAKEVSLINNRFVLLLIYSDSGSKIKIFRDFDFTSGNRTGYVSLKFSEQYIQSNMQYAQLELNSKNHYHLRHNSNETGMCSILVYQADRIIIDNEQERF